MFLKAYVVKTKNFKIVEEKSLNATKNTMFLLASCSKLITGILVAKLVELSELDYNMDINKYLTNWKCPERVITLQKLLTHTSGATVHGFPGYSTNKKLSTLPTNIDILDGHGNTDMVEFKYNKWSYSGGGFQIIQQVLEDHFGKPFWFLLDKYICKPLKLKNTTGKMFSNTKLVSMGYVAKNLHNYPETTSAGIWSTAEDLLIIAKDLSNAFNDDNGKLLSKKSIKSMTTIQKNTEQHGLDKHHGWGLGMFIWNSSDGKVMAHDGWDYKIRMRFSCNLKSGDFNIYLFHVASEKTQGDADKLYKLLKDS